MQKLLSPKVLVILGMFVLLQTTVSCSQTHNIDAAKNLVISEGFKNPLGFYDATPSFSWKLPIIEAVKSQSAYRIVVASHPDLLPNNADLWDSKKQESNQSAYVEYQGKQLKSRQKAYWQVAYFNQDDMVSNWSEVAHFEIGLLNNKDWKANWIRLEAEQSPDKDRYNLINYKPEYLRRTFKLKNEIKKARLYITSKGVFEPYLNGHKVGLDFMAPGYTPYSKRIETMAYNVTDQLQKGKNILGIILGEGWHSGRIGYSKRMWVEKPLPQALCQLEVEYTDGTTEIIITDNNWKGSRKGPIRLSKIYDGEIYDANFELANWSTTDFDDASWQQVNTEPVKESPLLQPKSHRAVTQKNTLKTQNITSPEDGVYIFDMGQNMVGIPVLNIPVIKNQNVTIRFAEMLNQDGSMYTQNYRSAKSINSYIPKETGFIKWKPTFTFHGYRYVELTGIDKSKKVDTSWVTGSVCVSDYKQIGQFTSSHKKLNQLQRNIEWGMRGNFLDIPTDCPQRDERLGWTGDAQVFAPTSLYIGDVHDFWAAWLQSVREEQFKNGMIPNVVPNVTGKSFSSGWGDVGTVVPWELYFRTGDKSVLVDNYDMMRSLVNFYTSQSKNNLVEVKTYGDWLQPYPEEEGNQRGDTPKGLIGTAYYARSIYLTKQAAEVLKKDSEVVELQNLFDNVSKAFEAKYIDSNGKLTTPYESQTGYLMALGFNLVSDNLKHKVFNNLVMQIEKADNHLRTGFLGTPLLAPVLDAFGRPDIMYNILFKETYPSWFYSINQGATTMWERWNSYSHKDGFGRAGMNSFNHYAYGAIGQWMYERIAGIQPAKAGYKEIRVAPLPGGPLTSANATFNSPYGLISSSWKIENETFYLETIIPPNTTATIVIKAKTEEDIQVDGNPLEPNNNIEAVNRKQGYFEVLVKPGTYKFTSKLI